MIILNTDETRDYVLLQERNLPPEEQTRWKLRALGSIQRAAIEDSVASFTAQGGSDAEIRITRGKQALHAVRLGLAGVENLRDSKGNEVVMETNTVGNSRGNARKEPSDTFLNKLPYDVITELARAITETSYMTEDEAKNS